MREVLIYTGYCEFERDSLFSLRNKGWVCFLKEEMSRMFLKRGPCVARFGGEKVMTGQKMTLP